MNQKVESCFYGYTYMLENGTETIYIVTKNGVVLKATISKDKSVQIWCKNDVKFSLKIIKDLFGVFIK